MSFNFGSTPAKPAFGVAAPTSSFSFGSPGTPAATPSLFGATASPSVGLFGSTAAVKPTVGLFGSTPTSTPSTGLFGGTPAPSTGLFGSPVASVAPTAGGIFGAKSTSSAFSFGSPSAAVTSTNLFGTPAKTTTSIFGTAATPAKTSLFGTSSLFATTPQTGVGMFGAAKPATSLFGVAAPVPVQSSAELQLEEEKNLLKALTTPTLYGDERDVVIAKYNQIQAGYGTGRAYYTQQGAFVDLKPDNIYCKFKAIGYNCISRSRNKDGVVMLIFKKTVAEVSANQQQLIDGLQKLFGSKPNLTIRIDSIKPLPNGNTELLMYVEEQSVVGDKTRISASVFFQFLNTVKQQLVTQLAVVEFFPKVGLTRDQIKAYLHNPPKGVNPLIWKQSIHDNPDPETTVPIPMAGFDYLAERMLHQQSQAKAHSARMEIIKDEISDMKCEQLEIKGKIELYKQRLLTLSHSVLQVIIVQEIERKQGFAADEFDERMRNQLDSIQTQLNCPTGYKAKLNELLSQIRMQDTAEADVNYQKNRKRVITTEQQAAVTEQLCRNQDGIQILVGIMNQTMMDMKHMQEFYVDLKKKNNSILS